MNNSNTPTSKKVMTPLRLEPTLFQHMQEYVNNEKKRRRSFSINEYLTDLVKKDLRERQNEKK